MDSQQITVIKRDDRFHCHSQPTQMSRPLAVPAPKAGGVSMYSIALET